MRKGSSTGHFFNQPTTRSGQLLIIREVRPLAVHAKLQHWQTLHLSEFDLADAIAVSMAY